MGLNLVYSVLILFSVVSLYHASTCGYGSYCPATEDCKNTSYCQEGICPADEDILNMTESCDTGPNTPSGKPMLRFPGSTFSVSESDGEGKLKLMLSKPLNCCTVSVRVLVEGIVGGNEEDNAEADKDFMIPESGYVEVVFPAGQTEAPFTVPIKDDDIFEKSESFRVMIMPVSVPYGVELGNPRSSIAVIIDNDDVDIQFVEAELEVHEYDRQVKIEVGIANNKTSSRDISVLVEPTGNTATECDYDNEIQRLTIPAGNKTGSITIEIFNDKIYEFPEIFKVAFVKNSLEPSHDVTILGNGATVTIRDNEIFNYAGFEQSVYIIEEDNTSFMPMMVLDKPSPCCITIRAELVNYNSTESHRFGDDRTIFNYTFLTNETSAYPDANASILFSHDDDVENHTAFYISILHQSLPYGFKPRNGGKALIFLEDDDNYVRFSPENYIVHEDLGPLLVTLQLHKPALEEITIQVHPIPITATGQGVDFKGQRYNCTFEVNDKKCIIAIDIVDDMWIEDNETFRLDIVSTDYPANFKRHQSYKAFVTIVDDDYICEINNDTEEIIVMEGEKLDLDVYLSRKYRESIDVHYEFIHTSSATLGEDYNFSKDRGQLDFHHMITISTLSDTVIESDEIIDIRVKINSGKPVYCSTRVRIIDDNMCDFNQSEYEIEEGDKTYLYLTFTKAFPSDVPIKLDYTYMESTTDEDFHPKLPGNVTLDGGKKVVRIPIDTKRDTLFEENELFEVIASPPSDSGLSCKTNVTIIDNNMCRFDQELYNVTEGGKQFNLVLRLDKPLPEPIDVELQYDRGQIEIAKPRRKIQQVVHFKTMAKNDRLLHPYQQHTITARLPDGHMCSTKLGIIDDDSISIYFRKPQYKPDDKNDVLRHRPEWILTGWTGFVFNMTVLEVDGTATGHNPGEPKEMKDFERRDHHITITPHMTRMGYYYGTLPLDIIDDDIVEMREEYYSLHIYDNLPHGVNIGKHFSSTRVVIQDDDETTISLQDYRVKLSKGLYKDIRFHFTFKEGNLPPVEHILNATETSMDLPGSKDNIEKILVYFPEELKGCQCIHEDDNDNTITIMYEES